MGHYESGRATFSSTEQKVLKGNGKTYLVDCIYYVTASSLSYAIVQKQLETLWFCLSSKRKWKEKKKKKSTDKWAEGAQTRVRDKRRSR